jgi:hypothetical protein
MNETIEEPEIDRITKLVRQYALWFAGDPSATVEFYALPMIYLGRGAVLVIGTRGEASPSLRASSSACGRLVSRIRRWSAVL